MKTIDANTTILDAEDLSGSGYIMSMDFPADRKGTEKMIRMLIENGTDRIIDAMGNTKAQRMKATWKSNLKNLFNPYFREYDFSVACIRKAQEGIERLRGLPVLEHPKIIQAIIGLENNLATLKSVWLPQLEKLRAKKKRKNYLLMGALLALHVIFYGWLLQKV